jgi:hypothetical protein
MTYLEFTREFQGVRIFEESYFNGRRTVVEKPKSQLYWAGITPKQIKSDPKYILEKRYKREEVQ